MRKMFIAVGILSVSAFVSTSAFAEGDVAKGEAVFKKCTACHQIGPEAKNKVGPQLNGIVGRKIASAEGYKYGKDIVALGETGATWTKEELFEYLKDPKKYLRAKLENKKAKSKMSAKFKKEDDRNNVIAYLESLQPAEEEAATTN